MQALVLALLGIATTFGYLKKVGYLPEAAPFLLDILSMFVLVLVLVRGTQSGFRYVRPVYWIIFGAVMLVIACGAIANQVAPGPIVSGLRYYVRGVPFFLLPAVYAFSEHNVMQQLRLMLAVALLQLPISINQRLQNIRVHGSTGDTTQGTLLNSGILSVFLIAAVLVVIGLGLRNVIKARTAGLLFVILIIPTTLNETKATLLLLPLSVLIVFLAGAKPGARLKAAIVAATAVSIFLAVFVPVYDSLIETRAYGTRLGDFFTSESSVSRYVYSGAQIGKAENVGRLDSIIVSLQFLHEDPVRSVVGVGIGNASRSQLGEQFSGAYFGVLGPFVLTSFSMVSTELGLFGLALAWLLHWRVFVDASAISKEDRNVFAGIATGWCGVVALLTAAYFYKSLIVYDSVTTLFWYFSGLVAAERMRREEAAASVAITLATTSHHPGVRPT